MIAAALGIAAIAAYLIAVHRYNIRFPQRTFSKWSVAAYVAGTLLMTAALMPAFDAFADARFAGHMLQHLILTLVGPPLVLLGAPLLLVVAVSPATFARAIAAFCRSGFGHALFAPLTGWLAYVGVLWGTHFSPIYEWALEYPAVHVLEHLLLIASAFLFWGAVVQVGFAPRPIPYPVRMFYLFLAIPQGAFLGFALNASRYALYPHYLSLLGSPASTLVDQHNAGDLMWILGGFLLFTAFMCTAGAWAAAERTSAAT